MNTKKIIAFMLSLALIYPIENISMLDLKNNISVSAETTDDGFTYQVDTDTITITGYTGSDTNLTIPSKINGIPVTSIGDRAFLFCESLSEVTIPDSVTSIGSSAFSGCKSLKEITILRSDTSIGSAAFSGCMNLSTIYGFSNSTAQTYAGGNDDIKFVAINGTYDNISWLYSPNIKTLTITSTGAIPENFYEILDSTIQSNMEKVIIGEGITSIGYTAFYNCLSLKEINVDSNNKNYSSENGILFNKDKTTLICYPTGKEDSSYTIPEGVTSIGDFAFYNCLSLKEINVDSNNENYSSENGILFNKDKTTLICYPAGKEDSSYTIPEGVTSIGDFAFASCIKLESITILRSDTSIGDLVFENCTSLSTIYGFSNSTAQTYAEENSIKFVAINGTYTDDSTNTNISWIYSPDTKTLTITGTGAIPENFYEKLDSTIKSNMEKVIIGEGITSIGNYAFYGCSKLKSVTVPSSVTSIGDYAFQECINLESVTFEGNSQLTSIGNYVFIDCKSLKGITIPSGVETIGNSAFSRCFSLTEITIPSNVKTVGNYALYFCQNLESVTFEGNSQLTSIGDYAFMFCFKLTEIAIPSGVETIGKYQFSSCTELITITFVEISQLTSIDDSAFYNCSKLESITIPKSVTSIDNSAFGWCTSLTEITIPKSVTSIDNSAFDYCTSLTTINVDKLKSECENFSFPEGVTVNYAHSVTYELNNIKSSNQDDRVSVNSDYTTTLTAKDGYTLPESITVKVGDTPITEHTYDAITGELTIPVGIIIDDITIEATATLNEYIVTSNLTNIKSNGATTVNHGKEYTATLIADDGYTLPSSVTVQVGDTTLTDGYTFVDGVLTIDAEKVTDDITITAIAKKVEETTVPEETTTPEEPIEPIQFTSADLLKLKKHILGISNIDDISYLDVNQDNRLNILDFLTIKNSILNQ